MSRKRFKALPYYRQPLPARGYTWDNASAEEEVVATSINRGHELLTIERHPLGGDSPVRLAEIPLPTEQAYVDALVDLLHAAQHDGFNCSELTSQAVATMSQMGALAQAVAERRRREES